MFWGFLTLAVAFALADLSLPDNHHDWAPALLYAAVTCATICLISLLWPLLKRRARISPSQPDMPIADVTNYMVNDSSVKLKQSRPAEIEQSGVAKGMLVKQVGAEHQDALEKVQAALNNGMLDAWGYRELSPSDGFEQWRRPIPKDYWQSAYLNSWFCWHISQKAQTASIPGRSVEGYAGVMMNKGQVKTLWPPKSWWRRLLADLRGIRPKNYFGQEIDHHYRPVDQPK
jgi:hypothetical protein